MTIEEFLTKYGGESKKINIILRSWAIKKEVDDFLGSRVLGGYLIGDILVGNGLSDAIPSQLRDAFSTLMEEKADNHWEIRNIIVDKFEKGDNFYIGLMNKIQGQLGENLFIENAGDKAELASSGSQEAYDIMIREGSVTRYIQVKVYDDADAVIDKIEEVNEKIASGFTDSSGKIVEEVEFAVNSDIYEEVTNKANELGLSNRILSIGSSREDIRQIIEEGFDEVSQPGIVDFFSDIIGGALTVTALHTAINGFFLWKQAQGKQEAIENTLYSSIISTGGLIAAHLIEVIFLENITLILGGPILLIGGIGTRTILRRFLNKRYVVKRLIEGNSKLKTYCMYHEL